MIDRLQRIAQALQGLRLPSIVLGWLSLATLLVIIVTSRSQQGDRFLIPSFVGLLWSLSTYSFIALFQSVPETASRALGLFARVKRTAARAGYTLIGFAFVATTLVLTWMSFRLLGIWSREFVG